MGIKLSNIENLKINPEKPRTKKNISDFVIYLMYEYAIGSLKYDYTDTTIYPYIKQCFRGEITASELKNKFAENDETVRLYNRLPKSAKSKFDFVEWTEFMENTEWECKENVNEFHIGDFTFTADKMFLNLIKLDGDYYAQRYLSEDSSKYVTFGREEDDLNGVIIRTPYKFSTEKVEVVQNECFRISSDEFFDINYMQEADENQKQAIKADICKNLVILAGAGSGKTRTLVCRLAYLHMVKGIPLNRILLLTFTKKAANEMKGRSQEIIEPIYTKYEIKEKVNINARTINSFIYHLVDDNYAQLGFSEAPLWRVDDNPNTLNDKIRLLDEVIKENQLQGVFSFYYEMDGVTPKKYMKFLIDEVETYASGMEVNIAGIDILLRFFLEKQVGRNVIMGHVYANLLVKEALCDMNSNLKNIIETRYDCILIDEFQDVNILQHNTFEPFYDSKIHFTYVGDDDQSIYGFRGSDNAIIRRITTQKNVNTIYLLTNYRNNPNIVEAGNITLRTIKDRAKTDKEIKAARTTGAKIKIMECDPSYSNLANEIDRLIQNGQKAEEICILTRNGKKKELLINALKAMNIPIDENGHQFKITVYYRLMKAIINVLCGNDVIRSCKEIKVLSQTKDVDLVYSDMDIEKIILGRMEVEGNLRVIKSIADEIRLNYTTRLSDVVYRYSLKAAELFMSISNERLDDEGVNFFENYCKNNAAPWPITHSQLNAIFKNFEHEAKFSGRYGLATLKGVNVTTIHQSKGLEYNVVIITGLSAGECPDTKKIDDDYSRKKKQLEILSNSKQSYRELKQQISVDMYNLMIKECDGSVFEQSDANKLNEFKEDILVGKRDIVTLTADGVEDFITTYRNNVMVIENRYKDEKIELIKRVALYKMKLENLQREIQVIEDTTSEVFEEKQKEIVEGKETIAETEKEIEKICMLEEKIISEVSTIRMYYSICLKASGFLADMAKADKIEQYKEKLLIEREKQLNEERRVFYVALTRARDLLYLCYEKGTPKSEFITLIPEKLKNNYIGLSKEQQREFERVKYSLKQDMEEEQVTAEEVDTKVDFLINNEMFKGEINRKIADFKAQRSLFANLSPTVDGYLNKALGLLFLGELTDTDFTTEFAHNMQRMAEEFLIECAGDVAIAYKTSDRKLAARIARKVRENAAGCLTQKPSEDYLFKLVTEESTFVDEMKNLKSAGVMHYIVRSGEIKLDTKADSTWKEKRIHGNAKAFLTAVIDLANMRNSLIHPKENNWTKDPVPHILKNMEIVIRSR